MTVGITLSFLFAVPLGLMIGRYQLLDTMTDWSIQIFRSIPPIALIPLGGLKEVHFGRVGPDDSCHAMYHKHLRRTVEEPFALFLPG